MGLFARRRKFEVTQSADSIDSLERGVPMPRAVSFSSIGIGYRVLLPS